MKTRITKILFTNIFILILIYFASTILGQKLHFQKKTTFLKIPLNLEQIKEYKIIFNDTYFIDIDIYFFQKYIDYLLLYKVNDKKFLIKCPKDIFEYNARNIHIYDFIDKNKFMATFNVTLSTYDKKFDNLNNCFELIFIDELNNFFLDNLSNYKKILLKKKNILKKTNENYLKYHGKEKIEFYQKYHDIHDLEFRILFLNQIKYLVVPSSSIKIFENNKNSTTIIIFITLFLLNILIQLLIFLPSIKKKKYIHKFFGTG